MYATTKTYVLRFKFVFLLGLNRPQLFLVAVLSFSSFMEYFTRCCCCLTSSSSSFSLHRMLHIKNWYHKSYFIYTYIYFFCFERLHKKPSSCTLWHMVKRKKNFNVICLFSFYFFE